MSVGEGDRRRREEVGWHGEIRGEGERLEREWVIGNGIREAGGVEGLGANEKRDGHLSRSPVQSLDNERGVLDRTSREQRLPKNRHHTQQMCSPRTGRGGGFGRGG